MFRRLLQLIVGLFLFGFGTGLMIRANLGLDPWTVFSQGLAQITGLSIGTLTIIIGVVVLLFWIPLRVKPGVGTVLNILIIGIAIDLSLDFLVTPAELWQQVMMLLLGVLLVGIASGLYIGSRFGAGPRDGLMVGLNQRFGIPIWIARTSIEILVLAIGWLLGGTVGIGTVVFAAGIGPICGITIPLFTVPVSIKRLGQSQ